MTKQHGHVNRLRHDEVTSRDIPNLSDRRSYARSRSSNIVARFVDFNKETGEVHYSVTSQAKAGKSYTVTFRFKDWNPDMAHLDDEIQHAVKSNIEIDCTCPAFTYQGYKFLASIKGGSVDIERSPPDETNPDRHGYACKHILKAIDSFNQDFDKFRAEGKGMIKKHNLRVQHKYENKKSLEAKDYSLSEMLDMQLLTYCDEVLGLHLMGLKSQSVLESIASAFLSYMEQLMDLDGIDLGETYDDFRRCISQGKPRNNVSVDADTQTAFDKLVKTLKRHFDRLQGGMFDVKEARGGATGHFPTGIRIYLNLVNESGIEIWINTLDIPLYLCFAPTGKLRLLSLEQVKNKINDWIVDEVQNLSDDWDRMRRNFESKRPRRSSSRKRFESNGLDAYSEIANDLSDFIDKVQVSFEAVCKNEFHFRRVNASIDIEDGLESDDGVPAINVVLCDDRRSSRRDSLAETMYSFDGDGIHDDNGDYVGETVEDLISDIASRFASEYDNANSR